jgi:hypothetical protein
VVQIFGNRKRDVASVWVVICMWRLMRPCV